MTTQNNTRQLITRKGKSVNTPYTDEQALGFLEGMVRNEIEESEGEHYEPSFAGKLFESSRKWGLSHDQNVWCHILVCEARKPYAAAQPAAESFLGVVTDMHAARDRKDGKRVAITLGEIRLAICGDKSRTPGGINVTDTSKDWGARAWYGTIDASTGAFHPRNMPAEALAELRAYAADPAATAGRYGRATGTCCFCSRQLTDLRSVGVGFGPTCAEYHSLTAEWAAGADQTPEDAAVAAEAAQGGPA